MAWPVGRFDAIGESGVSYDFSDPIWRGGGPFGGLGSWSWTVVAYDVAVEWFEFVVIPDAPPPRLTPTRVRDRWDLTWHDPWSAYVPEWTESLSGRWQSVTNALGYDNGKRSLGSLIPLGESGGFYRLVPRNSSRR